MKNTLLALALLALAWSTPAHATAPAKIFVASTGQDTNPGTRDAPMRNFQAAHDAVVAGGEIIALDTAGYGVLNITKSLSVVVPPGVNGIVTAPYASSAVIVNAGTTGTVSLSGLILEGTAAPNYVYGVRVDSVGTLIMENCVAHDVYAGLALNTVATANIYIHGGSMYNVVTGIQGSAASATTGLVIITVSDWQVTGAHQDGILVDGEQSSMVYLSVSRCVFTANVTALKCTRGSIYTNACTFSRNTTAVSPTTGGVGGIDSFGNNFFSYNGSDGTFTTTATTK